MTAYNKVLLTDNHFGDVLLTRESGIDYDFAEWLASNINKDYPRQAWVKRIEVKGKLLFQVWVTNSYYRGCEIYVMERCNLSKNKEK